MKPPGDAQTLFVVWDHISDFVTEIRDMSSDLKGDFHQVGNVSTRNRGVPHVDQDIVARVQGGDAGELSGEGHRFIQVKLTRDILPDKILDVVDFNFSLHGHSRKCRSIRRLSALVSEVVIFEKSKVNSSSSRWLPVPDSNG